MKDYYIKVTTPLQSYGWTYKANDITHARKQVQGLFIKGDYFVFAEETMSVHVPIRAVLEVVVEERQ